ncbi:hypothetical protein KEM54_003657 [Ascosphaera aggregata]|nr:hypothetical protein KEM54_003657 [Ascosphaera aggregata]
MLVPDPNVSGRLWNSGLAYFGWLFYVSKFYEVIDTLIILAKGKKSSTLQTYHHAGAMLCMWAGIRYSAGPIWIFPTFNSLIHALMYTYYTLTAFHVPVPIAVKRSLTTMQIIQFIIGVTLATTYLCIKYTIPIVDPLAAIPIKSSTAPATATTVSAAVAGMGALISGFVARVLNNGVNSGAIAYNRSMTVAGSQTEYLPPHETVKIVYRTFNAVDTPGQAFGVWLNVLYLLPLTWLFARFFVRSYLRRSSTVTTVSAKTHVQASEKELPPTSKFLLKSKSDGAVRDLAAKSEAVFSSSDETLIPSSSSDEDARHRLAPKTIASGQPLRRRRSSVTFQSFENAELAGLDALRKVGREIMRFPAAQDGTGFERKKKRC